MGERVLCLCHHWPHLNSDTVRGTQEVENHRRRRKYSLLQCKSILQNGDRERARAVLWSPPGKTKLLVHWAGWGQKGRTSDEKVNVGRTNNNKKSNNSTHLEPVQDLGAWFCFSSPHSPSPNYRTEGRVPKCYPPCHQAAKKAVHSIEGHMYWQGHSGNRQWLLPPGKEPVLLPLTWAAIRNDLKTQVVVFTKSQEDQYEER